MESRPFARRRTTVRPSSCTRSPRRAAATSPRVSTRPTSSTPWARSIPRPASRSSLASAPSWTIGLRRRARRGSAERNDRLVGITAAMLRPTGLHRMAERFPRPRLDVGIAEQHAATSAAGLAFGGLHPVVAIYATFMNRAFDQVLMDVALHKAGVTFVLDRAGVTGPDGPSHHGVWDLAILQVVPGIRIAAPRDSVRLARGARARPSPSTTRRPCSASRRAPSASTSTRCERTDDGVDVLARVRAQGRADRHRRTDGRHRTRGRRATRSPGHRRDRHRPALGRTRSARASSSSRPSTASS